MPGTVFSAELIGSVLHGFWAITVAVVASAIREDAPPAHPLPSRRRWVTVREQQQAEGEREPEGGHHGPEPEGHGEGGDRREIGGAQLLEVGKRETGQRAFGDQHGDSKPEGEECRKDAGPHDGPDRPVVVLAGNHQPGEESEHYGKGSEVEGEGVNEEVPSTDHREHNHSRGTEDDREDREEPPDRDPGRISDHRIQPAHADLLGNR